MAPTVTTYTDVLSRNLRAQRGAAGINQGLLAERMRVLGYTAWLRQTVANVEKGRRGLRAEEIVGLALALETSIAALTLPSADVQSVQLTEDYAVPGRPIAGSILYQKPMTDILQWDGSTPQWYRNRRAATQEETRAANEAFIHAEGSWGADSLRVRTLIEQNDELARQLAELRKKLGEEEPGR